MGLPYYRPFMAKLHYIEFWVTSYNRGGWPVKAIFSQNVRDGEQNLLWVINLIYSAHNGRGVGLPYCRPFMAKLHYIEFWVTSYNRGGWPWRAKPNLIYSANFSITVLLWQNCSNFG